MITMESAAPFSAVNTGLPPHDEDNNSSGSFSLHLGISAAEAIMEAAMVVTSSSSIPGVVETAKLVSLCW